MLERPDEQLPGEDAHDDRRQSVEHVGQKRTTSRASPSRCSARYSPAPMPTGSPIARRDAARASSVPTIALAIPPPVSPAGSGICVKNASSMDDAPCLEQMPHDEHQRQRRENAATYVRPSIT